MVLGKIRTPHGGGGYAVIAYTHEPRRDGENEHGLLIADRGEESHHTHRYVVWGWVDDPIQGIYCINGTYTNDLKYAWSDYLERSRYSRLP